LIGPSMRTHVNRPQKERELEKKKGHLRKKASRRVEVKPFSTAAKS